MTLLLSVQVNDTAPKLPSYFLRYIVLKSYKSLGQAPHCEDEQFHSLSNALQGCFGRVSS